MAGSVALFVGIGILAFQDGPIAFSNQNALILIAAYGCTRLGVDLYLNAPRGVVANSIGSALGMALSVWVLVPFVSNHPAATMLAIAAMFGVVFPVLFAAGKFR